MNEQELIAMGFPAATNIMRNEKPQLNKNMKKFVVRGIYTEYIYAETEEQAIEQFDELMEGVAVDPFDEILCEELPLSVEN